MNYNKTLLTTALLLGLNTHAAQASLTSYTANGVDLVRMQGGGFDVSWTKDGNLFQTMANSYAGGVTAFINAVIASVPGGKINDLPNYYDTPRNSGYHTLTDYDFNEGYNVNWFGAQAYVTYLNSISYGGSSQWRLPTWTDTGATGIQDGRNGGDSGYNVNTASSELAQLYYTELGKKAPINTSGSSQNGYGILSNNGNFGIGVVGPFSNVVSDDYWLGTEYKAILGRYDYAWNFRTDIGAQGADLKLFHSSVWAVTQGQVAAVPVPAAVWLFGSGLLGILGLKPHKSA